MTVSLNIPDRAKRRHLPASKTCGTQSFTPDTVALYNSAETSPADAAARCRENMTELAFGFRAQRTEVIVVAYTCAYYFARMETEWDKFCADRFWDDIPKKPRTATPPEKRLGFVFRYVFSGTGKASRDRAQVYAKALQRAFNKAKKPKTIRIKLRAGIQKLIESERNQRSAATLQKEQDLLSTAQFKRRFQLLRKRYRALRKLAPSGYTLPPFPSYSPH